MDKQLYLMNRYQKDDNTIAYAFSEEIILIKREYAADGTAELFEIVISAESSKAKSKRRISDSEMKVDEFDAMKKLLTKSTKALHKTDVKISRRDCDLEKLENTEMACLPSVEDEYITNHFKEAGIEVSIENAVIILNAVLNEKQKKWFLMSHRDKLSDREIARREGVAQTTVSRGLTVMERKIEKYLKNFSENKKKYASKP